MPTNLTDSSVNSTFNQLLHIDGGPTSAEKTVYGGTGIPTALKLGTSSASVGNVRISGSTISTVAPNSNLVLAPNGTGKVQITGGLSFGHSVSLPSGVNLNTVVDTGFYRLGNPVVNGPSGGGVQNGQLIVSRGGDTITQIVSSYSTGEMWTRSGNPPEVGGGGSWSPWLKMTDGGVSSGYTCKAWVNFNGTGTVYIRASGNVSSVVDDNVGVYVVNFMTPMPDTNYACIATARAMAPANGWVQVIRSDHAPMFTTGVAVVCMAHTTGTDAPFDSDGVFVAVFR